MKQYLTPSGSRYRLFSDMAAQPHLLIGGATGSGKSVVVNGIITNLLYNAPSETGFILSDPKRTELIDYKRLPHVLRYATEFSETVAALRYALEVTEARFSSMAKRHEHIYTGGDIYIIIDELAFLMADHDKRKAVLPLLQRLGIIARAARVHLVACTQTVKADILPTTLTCNFDSRVALRTSTAQQSRMLIDKAGCETFPSPTMEHRALCYFRVGADLSLFNVPMYSEIETTRLIDWWTSRKCIA